MYVHKVVECHSLLEVFFFIKEDLLKGISFVSFFRNELRTTEELKPLLSYDHYYWTSEFGIAYTLLIDKYYADTLFKEVHQYSTDEYFKFILDNAEKIDKLYKLKSFI
jgi:hypothetical protein